MSDEWEEVEFVPGPPPTCEERELFARQHPPLELPPTAKSDWSDWRTSFGLTVSLPNDFKPYGEDEPDRMLFTTTEGESVFVVRDEGGNGIPIMQPQEFVSFEPEGQFCVKLAGRDATIGLGKYKFDSGEIFCASANAGITPGTGIGVVIWAVSAERRILLIGALATMHVQ